MVSHEYIPPPPPHPAWLEGNEIYAQLFVISIMIIFIEFLERGRSILLTVYLLLVLFPVVVVWWYLDVSGAMIGVCFWEWFQKRNHGGVPTCSCSPVPTAMPTEPQEPVVPVSSAFVPVVLPVEHVVSPSVPFEPVVHVVSPSVPFKQVVPVSSSLCSAGVSGPVSVVGTVPGVVSSVGVAAFVDDSALGIASGVAAVSGVCDDDVSSGVGIASSAAVSRFGDISAVVGVDSDGDISSAVGAASGVDISSGGHVASSGVCVASGDEVPSGAVSGSVSGVRSVGVSAAVSEDNGNVDLDGLCAAFFKLTVEDPYDEDVFMRLLDRRDFAVEEHVEYMEFEDMDYEEDPSLMSVVCSPVVNCVSAAALVTMPPQEDPIISSPLAIPATSPTDSANFIPVSLPSLPMYSAPSLAFVSPLSPPVIAATSFMPVTTATTHSITATPSPVITTTSPSPVIIATPSSPIITVTSPSPIHSVTSSSPLLVTTSPIITTTPLAIPSIDTLDFYAMPSMSPDTAAFVTPADILDHMNTILTATPTTIINDEPFMTIIDPMLLTIMDDIPFTTMLMTDILLPIQPQEYQHQEQQQLPSSPPESPLPPATVVDDFDSLFGQFIEMPDE
ncbi:hypothetical protein K492DRAFT_200527 [Lichtheimia hyalospora FSU 10163]|nr:hypothetical protein K492DRAFT_200527 [Lichtheimia hyalospora FSU 10163]